jgi:predicted neutral ceramidase superfamily lipid hydrolase
MKMKTEFMNGRFIANTSSDDGVQRLRLEMYQSIDTALFTSVTYNCVSSDDVDKMIDELKDARNQLVVFEEKAKKIT